MRIMNLPNLAIRPSSADRCAKTYLERLAADDAPWPHVSVLLTAYLAWPNNEDRRDTFIATCLARLGVSAEKRAEDPADAPCMTLEMFGGLDAIANVAFDHLMGEIGQLQPRWLLVADVFQIIVDMAHDERAVLHRGPSISKAIDLCECERGLPGRSQLRAAWSEFCDVAHLLTASAYLAHQGLAHAGADDASILKSIWTAPDAVLALAYWLQEFGLQPKSIRKEPPILRPDTLWRIRDGDRTETAFIVFRRLTEAQLEFLNSRRVA